MEKKQKRDSEKTRAHILDVAFLEIYTHSFQAVSIDRIVSKTQVTKGAFFHHFPTKNDLGYTLADEYLRDMMQDRWIKPLRRFKDPLQGVLHCFKTNIVDMPDEFLGFGCPLNNLCQEMATVDPKFRDILASVLTMWIEETKRHLDRGKEAGYLKPETDTLALAEYIVTMQEGAFGISKTLRDRKVLQGLYESLKVYFELIKVK